MKQKCLVKLIDTEGLSVTRWKKRFEGINRRMEEFGKEFEFTIKRREIGDIPLGKVKIKRSEKTGKMINFIYPDLKWLRKEFFQHAKDYDECVVHFDYDKLEDIVQGGDNDLGGWSAGNKYGVSEIIIRAKEDKKWMDRFLHENGHSTADHFMAGAPDRTHLYDYELGNLDAWIAQWDWTRLKGTKDLQKGNPRQIKIIKKHIDIDWSADNRWNEGNYFRADNDLNSIVLHTLSGSVEGSYSWLDAQNLSYHYLIDVDGTIYEQTKPEHGAWHAGRVVQPNRRAKAFYGKYGTLGKYDANPNRHSLGIAFARRGEEELTKEQAIAGANLIDHVGRKYDKRYTEDNIFAHYEITKTKPKEVLRYREQVLEYGEDYKGETKNPKKGIDVSPATIKKAERLIDPLKWLYKSVHFLFPSK